jgi:hypothetical protein
MNAPPPRPVALKPVDPRTIPAFEPFTRPDCRRWCGWRYEWVPPKDGKPGYWTKVPYRITGGRAAVNKPATWNTFAEIWPAMVKGNFDGIGLMLLDLKTAFIDLDDVRDPVTGVIVPWAEAMVREAGSYTEPTPSGCGLRIGGVAPASGPVHNNQKHPSGIGSYEVYANVVTGRYITITGQQLPGAPGELRDISRIVRQLAGSAGSKRKGNGQRPPAAGGAVIDLGDIDADIGELIEHGTQNGQPVEDRSDEFYKVVVHLRRTGRAFADVLATLEAHPGGVQEKYDSRLEKELRRVWEKRDADGEEFTAEGDDSEPAASTEGSTAATQPDDDPPWPDPPDAAAYHGLAGEVVHAIDPLTEADPVAVLVHFLIFFGNAAGPGPHYQIGRTKHPAKLNALVTGETSEGRKGTAKDDALILVKAADPNWVLLRVKPGGLVSGEGLIWHVRDARKAYDRKTKKMETVDEGVSDKRLMIIESEYGNVLAVVERKGNSLPGVLRQMFDDDHLNTLGKNEPTEATGVHGSMVSHVTPERLRRVSETSEIEDGSINRNLLVCARRSKLLPFPGDLDQQTFDDFVARIEAALKFARGVGRVFMTAAAQQDYAAVYPSLAIQPPGLLGAATKRAPVLVCRLALVYALLDKRREIDRVHLHAALALWRYCEASARYVFGDVTGNPVADEILFALKQAGPAGMTRNAIRGLFSGHMSSARIARALKLLGSTKRVRRTTGQPTGGRLPEVWVIV